MTCSNEQQVPWTAVPYKCACLCEMFYRNIARSILCLVFPYYTVHCSNYRQSAPKFHSLQMLTVFLFLMLSMPVSILWYSSSSSSTTFIIEYCIRQYYEQNSSTLYILFSIDTVFYSVLLISISIVLEELPVGIMVEFYRQNFYSSSIDISTFIIDITVLAVYRILLKYYSQYSYQTVLEFYRYRYG